MRTFFTATIISTIVTYPVLAQTPASTPASTAYQGTVGDWALGRWIGYQYLDANFTRLNPEDRVLIVTKLPDGRVGCQWATPAGIARAGYSARCEITASKMTLRTPSNVDIELNREGAELEGRYSELTARYRVHLHRETNQH